MTARLTKDLAAASLRMEAAEDIRRAADFITSIVAFMLGVTLAWLTNGREDLSMVHLWMMTTIVAVMYAVKIWWTRRRLRRTLKNFQA